MEKNRYFYFLCNIGSEAFLKEEISLFHPELRFSYSTKGFLTFKLIEESLISSEFVFCRHYGEFVNKGKTSTDLELEIPKTVKTIAYSLNGEISISENLKMGDDVYEIIKLKEDEYYLGKFKVKNYQQKFIGGFLNIELPKDAPSRAYLKILEGAKIANIQFEKNQNALEIGSSPGGATFALLERGINVIGVDPGIMSSTCLDHPNFIHHKTSIQDFDPGLIDKKIDWFLVDMNLSPEASLNEIEKIFYKISDEFQGAFITLKMTKIELVAKIPFYKKIITRLGLNPKLITQLQSHKQEFLLYVTK